MESATAGRRQEGAMKNIGTTESEHEKKKRQPKRGVDCSEGTKKKTGGHQIPPAKLVERDHQEGGKPRVAQTGYLQGGGKTDTP